MTAEAMAQLQARFCRRQNPSPQIRILYNIHDISISKSAEGQISTEGYIETDFHKCILHCILHTYSAAFRRFGITLRILSYILRARRDL